MAQVIYDIVEHDGGWAYKVGATFSETFRTREQATQAAKAAAAEQQVAGETQGIQYEDAEGNWHGEVVKGSDRPETEVSD
ncbi:hypothetical protein SAMN04488498_12170 [Mesorhizobium albiziae]|uniref:DUF2188 domain-containing protein n=1 Tax=Neomesorhizobium albiziae TaxID=335020 RepID=A0A1I4E0P2_9HYPH|nr:DUF2188 domain-containing protein [Mesorhizobium albiziae]GLS31239.1 hypothetical protein GCM10007937_29490 [Mesorhizobium albiziae]SFK99305.1 hypothetical protein SAMN04488498_12170 [Mesorhizobium albiziae]